jgi:methylamine dehydrogenase accessory protein MauD
MQSGLELSVLAIRVLLAAVFATAAVAKTAGRGATPATLRAFGVPSWAAQALAWLLPAAELAVAVALLPVASARDGALAAAGLLVAFTTAVAYQLARGRQVECNCFGRLHSAPIAAGTLIRNAVLLAGAVFVAVGGWRDPGPSAVTWMNEPFRAATAALGLLAAAQAVLLVALLRRHGRALVRLEDLDDDAPAEQGLPIGAEAPEFALPDLEGETVSLTTLREQGLPVLLLFSDPACGPCSALLPRVGQWQREHRDDLSLVVVSNGERDDNRASASEHGLTLVLRQEAHAVGLAYEATGTPMAVLVDVDGRIASPLAAGGDAIAALVASLLERSPERVLLHG